MFIVGKDIEGFRQMLKDAQSRGNEWMVLHTDRILAGKDDYFVFRGESEADDFCFIHGSFGERLATNSITAIVQRLDIAPFKNQTENRPDYYFFTDKQVFTNLDMFSTHQEEPTNSQLSREMVEQLIKYPFKELLHDGSTARLLVALQGRGEDLVEVERSIVPADHIEEYVLVKHHYPSGGTVYEMNHALETLQSFTEFSDAKRALFEIAQSKPEQNADFLILGRYQNKKLEFNLEGNLYPSNGYRAAVAYAGQDDLKFQVRVYDDPRLATTIKEQFKLSTNKWDNTLVVSDILGSDRKLDISFWQEQLQPVGNLKSLTQQLMHLEFGELKDELEQKIWEKNNRVTLQANKIFGEDTMQFDLHFQGNHFRAISLTKYAAHLQRAIRIEENLINGIDLRDLENRMRSVDWKVPTKDIKDPGELITRMRIAEDLQAIDPKTRISLKAKFWPADSEAFSPVEVGIVGLLNRLNGYSHTFHCNGNFDAVTATEAYVTLTHYAVKMEKILDGTSSIALYSNLKHTTMNKDNLEFLGNKLKYSGFGEELQPQLEEKMKSNVQEFTLHIQKDMKNRQLEATLHFKKGNKDDMYFFNKYDASLTKVSGQQLNQTFYMDKGQEYTFKEAFNLLDGRAVYKDLLNQQKEPYTAWIKLDFTKQKENGNYELNRYTEGFGYDLHSALEKLNPKEILDAAKKEDLIKSLQKGNLHSVTLATGENIWIAANPETGKANKLLKYDQGGKEITVEVRNVPPNNSNKENQEESNKKTSKAGVAQDDNASGKNVKKKQRPIKETADAGSGLLPKNRQGNRGKGQGV